MISNSSKRLSKIKKKVHKNDPSECKFLIESIDRQNNKQNNPINKSNYNLNSGKYSIQLSKPARINSLDKYKHRLNNSLQNDELNKMNEKNSPILLFQNVKFLKSSRMCKENSQKKRNLSKQTYRKNIQLSQNAKSKQITSVNKKSEKFTQNLDDTFENKLEAYVSFVNELFEEALKNINTQITNQFARKKCLLTTLGKQILREINKNNQVNLIKGLNKSIQVSNFCSFPSKVISRELQKSVNLRQKQEETQFKKIIDDLSQKNSKLTQLISQHQRKNIKMLIQMNENQSKEIQKCKTYLSSLYDKYKLLEKSIIKQNLKYKQESAKNIELQHKIKDLQKKNKQLSLQAEKLNEIIEENQTFSKRSLQDESRTTMFDFNINQKRIHDKQRFAKCNFSITQNQKVDKSFITKRQKASSCLSNPLNNQLKENQDDLLSCSTITKTKNMKKKKQKSSPTKNNIKIRTNQITNDSINSQLKKQITELKNKIIEEKKQKQVNENKIEDLQRKIIRANEKVNKMEKIINQQLQEIQKLMKINSDMAGHIKTIRKSSTKNESKQKQKQKQDRNFIMQKLKETHKICMSGSKKVINQKSDDEYRIIAMQAEILQKLINFS